MKFILFTHYHYYPSGGVSDIRGVFETLEEAREAGQESSKDEAEILDVENSQVYIYNSFHKEWEIKDLETVINS